MMMFVSSVLKAALAFFGYLGMHYTCMWLLPLSATGYTVCANIAAVVMSAAVFLMQKRHPLVAVGARALSLKTAALTVGVGIGVCLLVRLMMLTVPFPESWMTTYTERVELVHQAPMLLRYLSTVLVAPFAEEWVFRGLVHRALRKAMPWWGATLCAAALFSVLHGTIMWIFYTFLLGLLLSVLYERTQSLWSSVVCHVVFNIVGQLPLVGAVPDVLLWIIFAVGAILFVVSLYGLQKKA